MLQFLFPLAHVPKPSGNPKSSTFRIFHCPPDLLPKLKPWSRLPSPYPPESCAYFYSPQSTQQPETLFKTKTCSLPPVITSLPDHWLPISLFAKIKFRKWSTKPSDRSTCPTKFSPTQSHWLPTIPAKQSSLLLWGLALGLTPGSLLLYLLHGSTLKALPPILVPRYLARLTCC